MDIIKLENICKTYNYGKTNSVEALKNVNLNVQKNETLAIQGASGSGKSTLMHILGCLDRSSSGRYFLEEEEVFFSSSKRIALLRNKKFGFVLQHYGLLMEKTALDNISLPLLFSKTNFRSIEKLAVKQMGRLDILHLKNKKAKHLSGGEKQRVAIARALICNPDIIFADEPTGALDSTTGTQIIDTVLDLKESGKTIIIVTHDDKIAEKCDRIMHIKDGQLLES